jgi:hypothetical protein
MQLVRAERLAVIELGQQFVGQAAITITQVIQILVEL